jgi:hypothetical protein
MQYISVEKPSFNNVLDIIDLKAIIEEALVRGNYLSF